MEVNWYCWVTVISLVTNFHGCLCWPTLQPPLRPVTSKHELDSDESRKVLGSSVVTSVSVIMDHGNGTKTFLNDGIENPELKTNVIGSPGNLLNPDKYEFYTFDESGDLVKRLMTWDEIQGLIAGSDGDGILGDAAMPMFYSDTLPDKYGSTHITANDFQTSDIQGVHKVVESVQNVLKSELAASQSKIPPIAKPVLSNTPNWSLFLPTLIDNAQDGTDVNNLLGMVVNSSAGQPPAADTTSSFTSTSNILELSKDTQNTTEFPSTTPATELTTLLKEYTKKPEKPMRHKITTSKPLTPIKNGLHSNKVSSRPSAENSTFSSFSPKKPFSTSKYGAYSSSNEFWFTSTAPTSPKKTFTPLKYGGYVSNAEPASTSTPAIVTSSPAQKVSTFKYGSYTTRENVSSTTEAAITSKKATTTSKYAGQTTNNELFSSIANVLNQVTDDVKSTGPFPSNSTATAENPVSTLQYRVPTESNRFPMPDKFLPGTQHKQPSEIERHTTADGYRQTIENYQKPFTEPVKATTQDHAKTASPLQHKFSAKPFQHTVSAERVSSTSQYRPSTEPIKVEKTNSPAQTKYATESTQYTASESHKTVSTFHKPANENKYTTPSEDYKTGSVFLHKFSTEPNKYAGNDGHKTASPYQYKQSSTELNRNTITDNSIRKSTATTVTNDLWATTARVNNALTDRYNLVDDKLKKEPVGNVTNYVPVSSSTNFEHNEANKSTKTYESSTPVSTGHVSLQKQPLTMRPPRPTKINLPKISTRPYEHTFPMIRPQTTISSSTEKSLVQIPTIRTTESPTTRPEPFITWTSTFPAAETPSKIALNGIFDSDKLVTEQYVSSNDNGKPSMEDIFTNFSTTGAVEESSQVSEASESVTSFYNRASTRETSKPYAASESVTSLYNRSSTRETSKPYATTSFTSHTKESPSLIFSKTERPQVTEPKTESINLSTTTHQLHSSPSQIHTITSYESTETRLHRPTTKPTIQQTSFNDFASSEIVMQRVPTINPPNKNHTNAGTKFSTKAPFLSTESMKNITQIAIMLNKMNETSTRIGPTRNEYRNKVTAKPATESTKPINALFVNDCITSLISNVVKENNTTESLNYKNLQNLHSQTSKLPAASEEKENSHIYYYRLPPITSSPDSQRFSSTKLSTEANSIEAQHYKTEVTAAATRATTEKEYQKITTVKRPGDDVMQNGISAVTNILLQTEGRVPNKEMNEFELGNSTTPNRETTELSPSEVSKTVTTTASNISSSSEASIISSTSSVSKKPNQKIENTTFLQPLTLNENSTESMELIWSDEEDGKRTNDSATTDAFTTDMYEATTLLTTTTGADFKHEYVLDDRNRTQEEEEDKKNYHPYNYTVSHQFENNRKSNTTATAATYGESVKFRNATVVTTPTRGSTTTTTTTMGTITTTAATTTTTTTTIPSTTATTATTTRASTEKSSIKTTTYKYESKNTTNDELNQTSTEYAGLKNTTEFVEVPLENKTKLESSGSELSQNSSPAMGFRSPSNSVHRVSSTPSPGVELHPAPHESMGLEASVAYLGDDVKRFVDFCNELSFKIWTTQTGKNLVTTRSIVLSPFSVLSTLAMIFLGARGSSSGIMNDFLRLDDMVTFNPHQVFQNISESVVNTKNIGVANAAFVREIFSDKAKGKILDFYKERLQQYYDTHVEEITFNIIGDLVRRRTNLLVKRQTQGRIQDYLRGSALVLKPPLAVLTANIFQTDCDMASTEGRDGEMYFVVRPSTRQRRLVPIPAVVYRNGFLAGYEPGLDATAVTLNPESIVSTILVLPGQQGQVAPGDGLTRLEQRLLESSYRRGAWSRLLRSLLFRPGLELQIPRFSHKSVLNLTAGLQKMGMEDIFASDKADLRGINGLSNELHLSDIVQVNTFSTCGEETVGARHHIETYPSSPQRVGRTNDIFDRTYLDDSANSYYSSLPLNLRPRQARLPDNPRLRFDRPFVYIVRHNPTGLILYIGRFNPRLLP